ncbi:MAG: hypothetical protein HC831_02360 [Chloroflexia bacterium]|nr:hypothetical protein [Chloroflexia bacterium]
MIDYNIGFHNYDTWRITNSPEVLRKKKQDFFYMIQVAEYNEPLDLAELHKKYDGESIVWIKEKDLHKYFINQKIEAYEKPRIP